MSRLRIAPKPAPLAPYEVHRRTLSHAKDRLSAVVDALEALEAKGTEHDHLLNLLVTTVIEQIEALHEIGAWFEKLGRKAVA